MNQTVTQPVNHSPREVPETVKAALQLRHKVVSSQKVARAHLEQSNIDHLNWIHHYAQAWGGICLSNQYTDRKQKHLLECANKHQWWMSYQSLSKGCWCIECAMAERRLSLETLHQKAREHGGECLSTVYFNTTTPMQWRCAKGHEWSATAAPILKGHWCKVCAVADRVKYDIETLKTIAIARGGVCLSDQYEPTVDLKLRCAANHEFTMALAHFIKGGWCVQCHHDRMRHHSLKDLQVFAEKHGGKCLSTEYHNSKQPIQWQCIEGHTWQRPWSKIMNIKLEWCPTCRAQQNQRRKIERLSKLKKTVGIPKAV